MTLRQVGTAQAGVGLHQGLVNLSRPGAGPVQLQTALHVCSAGFQVAHIGMGQAAQV